MDAWLKWVRLVTLLGVALLTPMQQASAQNATPAATPTSFEALPDPSAPETGPVSAEREYRLALLVPFPADPFWQSVRSAAVDRAVADGVTLDVFELSAPSVPEQLTQIDTVIAGDYDGLLLGPVDSEAMAPGVVSANAAGIPVLAIDTAPIAGDVISVVQTDNVAATRLAGEFIGGKLGGEGIVLNIRGSMDTPVAQSRDQGIQDGLAGFEDVSIQSSAGGWQFGNAYGLTSAQLPQPSDGTPTAVQPLVDAVFAASPEMALGAAQAIEAVQADNVFVVGFGATQDTLKEIRSGLILATIAEYPSRAGAISVDLMVRHLNGETVPPRFDSGFALVTRTNIDLYLNSGG